MSRYGNSYGRSMVRGGRSYSSSRGSYRGSSRGGNSWNGGGGGSSYGRSPRDRFSSFDGGYDKGNKYGSDRYSRVDDYPKAYRMDNYSSRDRHSPDRKRPRTEGPSSRHDSYGSRYDQYSERRGYSGDRERHFSSSSSGPYRREEFRRPPPPPSPRGSTRGRLSSRGSRGLRRERGGPPRRRMMDRSYTIRKRGLIRPSEYTRRSKLIRLRSTMPRRRRILSSEKESSSDEEEKPKEAKEKKEKSEKAEGEAENEKKEGEEKEGDEKMEVDEEGEEKKEKPKEKEKTEEDDDDKTKKRVINYIKLVCPQCNIRVSTFRRYEAHLQGRTHLIAMRKTAAKQRSILAQMRQAQRNAQNELEKSGENITDHTVFCPLCKLNYKQERKVHQASAAHKNMKKFLMPFCKLCKITYKSPMVYENHLCSIDHLTCKQELENASDAEEDNLDEFTTIDSVGELEENAGSNEEEKEEKKRKKKVSIGIELVKKIDAYYCDLCRMFLPRGTENEYPDILEGHCRKRFHMQRYIRHKENEELKKRAEKLQRKETAEREKKKDEPKRDADGTSAENSEIKEEPKEEPKESDLSKAADDDKLWEAVDKDLGELLEEGNKSDDDDEDSRVNGERFDRFKSAENEKDGKGTEEAGKPEEKSEKTIKEEEKK